MKINTKLETGLQEAIDNYYLYNPDTLMPLLIVALAAQQKLCVVHHGDAEKVQFCALCPSEIIHYDWVRLNDSLRTRIEQTIDNKEQGIFALGEIEPSLQKVYQIFHQYDTYTVIQEYHHRIGILIHHSSNEACEQALRQYATLCLIEQLLQTPLEDLQKKFLYISNYMLEKSGLQPRRQRIIVAEVLCALLQYDGKGSVYNPFAGCGIAAAMIKAGDQLFADGDVNEKLRAAAYVLNYGMGGSNAHFGEHDSTLWLKNVRPNFVLSTYMGYINGESAFDFCLSKCFETLATEGRFAGMIAPRDLFEHRSKAMEEAIRRDWLDTVVLLPFGEVAVLINSAKTDEMKQQVRFFNFNHGMSDVNEIVPDIESHTGDFIYEISAVEEKDFWKKLLLPALTPKKEHELVPLKDFVNRIERKTYDLSKVAEEQRVMAYIPKDAPYVHSTFEVDSNIGKRKIHSLFSPAYHLKGECILLNRSGALEPRYFTDEDGTAYFQEGYALQVRNRQDSHWVIHALNDPIVQYQLHPYGINEMLPETVTEEQLFHLQIPRPLYEEDHGEKDFSLPSGYVLRHGMTQYTLKSTIGHGSYGIVYLAESRNVTTGETQDVALKEFFPQGGFERNGVEANLRTDITSKNTTRNDRDQFMEECRIMKLLTRKEDSHVVPVIDEFEDEHTNTCYYAMPYFKESVEQAAHFTQFHENTVINSILKPICKALYLTHKKRILHLDVKPDNLLIDDNGQALLIDFGKAQQYDDRGWCITENKNPSTSEFASRELQKGYVVEFSPRPDIFGLAATVYDIIIKENHVPKIIENSGGDRECIKRILEKGYSPAFSKALVAGLYESASSRPKDIMAFLHGFPGCEDIWFE